MSGPEERGSDSEVGIETMGAVMGSSVQFSEFDPVCNERFVEHMLELGALEKREVGPEALELADVYSDIADEERGIAEIPMEQAYGGYDVLREILRPGLRLMVDMALMGVVHDWREVNVLGLGCGKTGEMVGHLLPRQFDRENSLQIDINPEALAEVRSRFPDLDFREVSYHDLAVLGEQYDLITGLSSLDNTGHPENVMCQIRDALVEGEEGEGGLFLHVQDIKPVWDYPLKELRRMGEQFPITALYSYGSLELPAPYNLLDVYAYETSEGYLSVVELFRRRFGRVIEETDGLELIGNYWCMVMESPRAVREAMRVDMGEEVLRQLDELGVAPTVHERNGFLHHSGITVDLGDDGGREYENMVSAVVTLAQRVSS